MVDDLDVRELVAELPLSEEEGVDFHALYQFTIPSADEEAGGTLQLAAYFSDLSQAEWLSAKVCGQLCFVLSWASGCVHLRGSL